MSASRRCWPMKPSESSRAWVTPSGAAYSILVDQILAGNLPVGSVAEMGTNESKNSLLVQSHICFIGLATRGLRLWDLCRDSTPNSAFQY
jgi:hypothetical protein